MKSKKVYKLISTICFALAAVCLILLFSGCASFTEEYWAEVYANMTPEELESAKAGSVTVTDIWFGAQTNSRLVCFDGECVVVQIY
ncbi:MAG: hypothetical protein V3S33_03515 [Gammaproteobacteria bacterium]